MCKPHTTTRAEKVVKPYSVGFGPSAGDDMPGTGDFCPGAIPGGCTAGVVARKDIMREIAGATKVANFGEGN